MLFSIGKTNFRTGNHVESSNWKCIHINCVKNVLILLQKGRYFLLTKMVYSSIISVRVYNTIIKFSNICLISRCVHIGQLWLARFCLSLLSLLLLLFKILARINYTYDKCANECLLIVTLILRHIQWSYYWV